MANDLLFELTTPRTDTQVSRWGDPESTVLVPATATATAEPDANTSYAYTGDVTTVRLFALYTGTVTACTIVLKVLQDDHWCWAGEIALDPAAHGDELTDALYVGKQTRFTVWVSEISGGGTVEIRVLGME